MSAELSEQLQQLTGLARRLEVALNRAIEGLGEVAETNGSRGRLELAIEVTRECKAIVSPKP